MGWSWQESKMERRVLGTIPFTTLTTLPSQVHTFSSPFFLKKLPFLVCWSVTVVCSFRAKGFQSNDWDTHIDAHPHPHPHWDKHHTVDDAGGTIHDMDWLVNVSLSKQSASFYISSAFIEKLEHVKHLTACRCEAFPSVLNKLTSNSTVKHVTPNSLRPVLSLVTVVQMATDMYVYWMVDWVGSDYPSSWTSH